MLPAPQESRLSERFLHEARAIARVNHPNIVDIYDVGTYQGSFFLVMELLQGESLSSRLHRGSVPAHEAIALLLPVFRGVAAAHAHGVIHRDLKPDNIFLCTGPAGEVRDCKVLDFGISKIVTDEARDHGSTGGDTVIGTPYYMSPEQIKGLHQVDARADVYAFGVILYRMLTGAYPFDADTYAALLLKIATAQPMPLLAAKPEVDPTLAEVVMTAMARDRSRRYQSVAELARALQPFTDGAPRVSAAGALAPPAGSLLSSDTVRTPRLRRIFRSKVQRRVGFGLSGVACLCGAAVIWAAQVQHAHRAMWQPAGPEPEFHLKMGLTANPHAEDTFANHPPPPSRVLAAAEATQADVTLDANDSIANDESRHWSDPHSLVRSSARARSTRSPARSVRSTHGSALVGASATRNRSSSTSRALLPNDWDERIPTGLPAPPVHLGRGALGSSGSPAGRLSPADL
jgi:serine/threonine-protein kinase